jgi:hypothetical protein
LCHFPHHQQKKKEARFFLPHSAIKKNKTRKENVSSPSTSQHEENLKSQFFLHSCVSLSFSDIGKVFLSTFPFYFILFIQRLTSHTLILLFSLAQEKFNEN